ncbi:MAG TPA: right-handed parallel beta-helix repeat-containing protein [Anaerolineae bacterium]|nr:right-handed parallel beta-helix repeat-containing protein [Anaerolineae bacterium]
MKSPRLFLACIGGIGLVLLLAFALEHAVQAQGGGTCDRYVVNDGNNSPTNNCSDPNNPCKSIQYALKWASAGETICVADRDDIAGPSAFYGPIVVTKTVTLDGAWQAHPNPVGTDWVWAPTACNPENVILDGNGTSRVISITKSSPTIDCFTISGGNAGGAADDSNHGGGIAARNAAPLIVNNIITGNYGCMMAVCTGYGRGGGIYLVNAPATAVISNNLIANNVADDATWGQGGGIYLENASPQVLSNTLQTNRAGHSAGNGGGIAVIGGSPVLADNRLLRNIAGQGVMAHGGGIFVDSDTAVTIERNLIQGNVALKGTADPGLFSRGGGIFFDGPLAVIRDNRVYGNVAALLDQRGLGGGMYLHDLSAAAEVSGNVVAEDNRASYVADGNGGGLYLDDCYATVTENRVFDNIAASDTPGYGGGFYVNGGGGLIQSNVITGNMAVLGAVGGWGWGGGMAISRSVVLVQDNRVAQNVAIAAPDGRGAGGGVYVWGGTPRFVGNEVLSNTTSYGDTGFGGGFALSGASSWLEGNTILDNQTSDATTGGGGGVDVASCSTFTLTNNIIARNAVSATGSGVAIVNSGLIRGRMAHNTLVANLSGDGVGVYVGGNSKVLLYNNIIVSQTVGITYATEAMPLTGMVTADYTLFEGNGINYGPGVTSTNEVSGPAGLSPTYHLQFGSNAVDHATPLAWVTTDVDGDLRPIGPLPDIGADERWMYYVYLPLVLRN